MNKIVALVGMCGSGKSVVCEMFEGLGFKKVYFGGLTMEELTKRGLEKNEANERSVREGLRREHGPAAFSVLAMPKIEAYLKEGNVIIDGLYSWSEYKYLKERLGGNLKIVAVVTDSGLRYERLSTRTVRPLTEAEAISRDVSEIENIEKGGPIAAADHYIENNGSLEELSVAFGEVIKKL